MIHHSGVDVDSTSWSIAEYHVSLGWPSGGYAFVCHWGGQVDWCNDLETMSYHVAGLNKTAIGICIPGNWQMAQPPEPAIIAARMTVAWIRAQLGREVPVVGHREIALPGRGTTCPGDTWPRWRSRVA
ncbi:MAG: peptidoglycan recognition family protein [Pseudomonadota bacterium]